MRKEERVLRESHEKEKQEIINLKNYNNIKQVSSSAEGKKVGQKPAVQDPIIQIYMPKSVKKEEET